MKLFKVKALKDFYYAKTQTDIKKGEVIEISGGDKELLTQLGRVTDYIEEKEIDKEVKPRKKYR